MNLRTISRQVFDVAANEQAIAYARKDTKADGSAFASFHFCDWETLQSRPIAEAAYLQIKFGSVGAFVAGALGEAFSCRAARLPDGGCAVLRADSMLCLFRPDGRMGAQFFLGYGPPGHSLGREQAPAYDIVAGDGNKLWFTAPARDALVLFSLGAREMELRIGGAGVFSQPRGITRAGNLLLVSCAGGRGIVKTMQLPSYELGTTIPVPAPPEKYFSIFRRDFMWTGDCLYACLDEAEARRV